MEHSTLHRLLHVLSPPPKCSYRSFRLLRSRQRYRVKLPLPQGILGGSSQNRPLPCRPRSTKNRSNSVSIAGIGLIRPGSIALDIDGRGARKMGCLSRRSQPPFHTDLLADGAQIPLRSSIAERSVYAVNVGKTNLAGVGAPGHPTSIEDRFSAQ